MLLGFGVIILYTKLLWLIVFKRMRIEGMSFWAAIQIVSINISAFVLLFVCVVIGSGLAFVKNKGSKLNSF